MENYNIEASKLKILNKILNYKYNKNIIFRDIQNKIEFNFEILSNKEDWEYFEKLGFFKLVSFISRSYSLGFDPNDKEAFQLVTKVIIENIQWEKIILHSERIYNNLYFDTIDGYGFEKQLRLISKVVYERYLDLEKTNLILLDSHIIYKDRKGIKLLDCFLELEKEKIIIINDMNLSLHEEGFEVECGFTNIYNQINFMIVDSEKLKKCAGIVDKILDYNKIFYFDEKTFKLKISDGSTKAMNLSTTKVQGSDTYFLMISLVELLKKNGSRIGTQLSVNIQQRDIAREVEKHIKNKTINNDWLKNTKANLLKNIPKELKDYIKISNYDRSKQHYMFELKMPE